MPSVPSGKRKCVTVFDSQTENDVLVERLRVPVYGCFGGRHATTIITEKNAGNSEFWWIMDSSLKGGVFTLLKRPDDRFSIHVTCSASDISRLLILQKLSR